jgi:hypothetical protein
MRVGSAKVTINVRSNSWVGHGPVVATVSGSVRVDEEIDLNRLPDELGQFVFEAAGRPYAYQVEVKVIAREQGGSGSWAEIVIELLDDVSSASWEVLLALVVEELRRMLGQRDE